MQPRVNRANDFAHPITKPRLVLTQIEMMLAHVLRLPDVFNLAQLHLKADLFHAGIENHYRVLWEVAKALAAEHTPDALFRSPEHAYSIVEVTVAAHAANDPADLPEVMLDKLMSRDENAPGLLYWLYRQIDIKELRFQWGRDLLKDFCFERAVHDNIKRAVAGAGGSVMLNMPEFLQSLRDKHSEIQSLDQSPAESGAPDGWYPTPMKKVPTLVTFLDYFLKGGHAGKEVYGVLGAFGSGKTCLAVSIAAQGSGYQLQLKDVDPSYNPKEWYLFSYEATLDELRIRLWSQMCTIDHTRLEDLRFDQLSTNTRPETLQEYEKLYFAEQTARGVPLKGERERYFEQQPYFNKNLWLYDMTGSDPDNPRRGSGYIDEIVVEINKDLRNKSQKSGRQHTVGGVVVDYAGLVCRRYLSTNNLSYDTNLRHKLSEFGNECKRRLAVPYDCPVWVFHQLSGEANRKKFTAKLSHADAAESKSFAENLVFCFEMGTKSSEYDVFYLHCTKARRGSVGRHPLLKLEGSFFRITEAKDLEESGGKIMPSKEARQTVRNASYAPPSAVLPTNLSSGVKPLPDSYKSNRFGGALDP